MEMAVIAHEMLRLAGVEIIAIIPLSDIDEEMGSRNLEKDVTMEIILQVMDEVVDEM